ncbi:MAG: hypothetical protein ACM3JJ_07765 [Hyphomicrobiales bacterium]
MQTVARSAALIAFSVACGYAKLILFPFLFFVEIFSVAVFLSGAIMGAAWGAWIGAASRFVWSVANPYGPPHPIVLAAQVAGAAALGAIGGVLGRSLLRRSREGRAGAGALLVLALAGIGGTAFYDLLTNAAQGVAFGGVRATLALAAIPSLQHIASNGILFAVIGRLAMPWLARHPGVVGDAA